ncbi:MAG: transcriptional regulator [Propionibacteriaceae bacterium]|jgi:predicted ArsR family transcriptional regulator|nr:transcriptional regulator [Propionibacteriaceae bacterium]
MATKEEVLAVFAASDKPLKANDVVEILGIERKELDKHMKALKAEGAIVSPKVCFYTAA